MATTTEFSVHTSFLYVTNTRILRNFVVGTIAASLLFLAGCSGATKQQIKSGGTEHTDAATDVTFERLAEGIWMHTSYWEIEPWGLVRSNGLIVVSEDDVILVDTAWNDAQTEEILAWTSQSIGREITKAVVTHAHADKMGGVGALRARGVETYAHPLSNEIAEDRGLTPASHTLELEQIGDSAALGPVEVFYPGPGHTRDNIVVYMPSQKVLFGGCLIRPGDSESLGNVGDADVEYWARAVQNAAERYSSVEVVVPSHGASGSRSLLEHTVELASPAAK